MVEEFKGPVGLVPIIIGVAFMMVAIFDPRAAWPWLRPAQRLFLQETQS